MKIRACAFFWAMLMVVTALYGPVAIAGTTDRDAIIEVMLAYEAALNASDAKASIALYTDDGVLMAPNSPPVVGKEALSALYQRGAQAFTLAVKFDILETVQTGPDWAFVRTTSAGTMNIHSTGAKLPEANQELFVLKKGTDRVWRIARYSFSSTLPADSVNAPKIDRHVNWTPGSSRD